MNHQCFVTDISDGPCWECEQELESLKEKYRLKTERNLMNSTQVAGIVETIGTKFNGSVKVNGSWYNFKKGVSYTDIKTGDQVLLELGQWEFKGKTGVNVESFTIKTGPVVKVATPAEKVKSETGTLAMQAHGRDFDAENRGKVRHGLMVSLLPMVAQEVVTLEEAKKLVNDSLDFVMKGE